MTITSPHNEQLKEIRKLAGRKWRDKLRTFVAEGEDLVAAAAAATRSSPSATKRPRSRRAEIRRMSFRSWLWWEVITATKRAPLGRPRSASAVRSCAP